MDERSASPVIGNILLVAVVVIIAATVGVLALGLAEENEQPPRHALDYEPYNDGHGVVYGVFAGGQSIDTTALIERGGAVNQEFSGFTATAGDSHFMYARPGDTVQLVWTSESGKTYPISRFDVPDDATLEFVDWDGSTSDAAAFTSSFWNHNGIGGEIIWQGSTNYIEPTSNGNNNWGLYSRTVPGNDGDVTVDLHLETNNLGDSGYQIRAVDKSGERYELWCEDSASGADGVSISCDPGTPTIDGTQSRTVSVGEEIGSLSIAIDLEDSSSEIQIHEMKVSD